MKVNRLLGTVAVGVFGLWAACASATITFTIGNVPQSDENNILFQTGETGTSITGQVDHSGVPVTFSSTQTLVQNAQGQADIFALGGVDLTNIAVTLGGGYTFGDFILNLQNGHGIATVTVLSAGNTFSYTLGNGQNFLTIVDSLDAMTSITVSMSTGGGFTDFKQPRISQVCLAGVCVPQEVPEPATLMLLSIGLLSLGFAARRRKS